MPSSDVPYFRGDSCHKNLHSDGGGGPLVPRKNSWSLPVVPLASWYVHHRTLSSVSLHSNDYFRFRRTARAHIKISFWIRRSVSPVRPSVRVHVGCHGRPSRGKRYVFCRLIYPCRHVGITLIRSNQHTRHRNGRG